jgi:hypothetical protein
VTQNDLILNVLRDRGGRGLTPREAMHIETTDGIVSVFRLAARVKDLRDRGHDIRTAHDPNGPHARYILVEDVCRVCGSRAHVFCNRDQVSESEQRALWGDR